MKTYIITRFSIYDPSYRGVKIATNNNTDKYKEKLFNEDRLNFKFFVFKNITFKSVISQSNQNYEWHIYASEYLPEKYKMLLNKITDGYSKIKVKYITCMADFYSMDFPNNENYATIRLDDDDGLSVNFIKKIQKYSKYDRHIVTFPKGIKYGILNNKIVFGKRKYLEKNAQGMTAINMNVYRCGPHRKVDDKYNIINDYTPNMYLICCSEHCDTKRRLN